MNIVARAIREHLQRRGAEAVWIHRTGDICPCVEGALAGGRPDPGWHEANPTEPNCDGLGIINVQESRTDLRVILCTPREVADWELEIVGQFREGDKVLIADVDSEIDGFETQTDQITALDDPYTLLWVLPYRDGDTVICYYGLARITESKHGVLVGP